MKSRLLIVVLFTIWVQICFAQEYQEEKKEAPGFNLYRAKENYAYLKNPENNPYKSTVWDGLKFIPLNAKKDKYISFGGQIRPRFEHYSNRFWEEDREQSFYSQRLALHTDLHLGKYMRVFTELYHGYTSHEREFVENDVVDVHQAFVAFNIPFKQYHQLALLFGRQELSYGSARLVGLREGPNIRRAFDAIRAVYKKGKTDIQAFYSKEVRPTIEAFDNSFSLFDGGANNPELWGIYSQFKIKGFTGMNEVYYLGYRNKNVAISDLMGKENRHSVGVRRFGKIGKRFQYNTEIIYQFGILGDATISAFNLEGDWHYMLINTIWQWKPGIKLEYTSGDRNIGDDRLNTFNPMFVNPAYYSLAATVTPMNLISMHPSISFKPINKCNVYFEWGIFWRASKVDGLYSPPRFINRAANGISNKNLGNQFGLELSYQFNRHLSFQLSSSYFSAGSFQETTGAAESILHIAPTLNYKF